MFLLFLEAHRDRTCVLQTAGHVASLCLLQSHTRESCVQSLFFWRGWHGLGGGYGPLQNLLSLQPGKALLMPAWKSLLLPCVLQSGHVLYLGITAGRIETEEGTRGNKKTILFRSTVFYWFQSVFTTSPLKFPLENNLFVFSHCICDYKWKCKHVCGPLESHFLHSSIELGSSELGKVFSENSLVTNVSHKPAAGIQKASV